MNPLSLKNQSMLFVICHLELFPDEELRHIISSPEVRRNLLMNLPVVDTVRLERAGFKDTTGKRDFWDDICSMRIPRGNSWEVEQGVNYDLSIDDWRAYYFCIVNHVLLNHCKTDAYRSHFELALHLLFGVQNCLGIADWSKVRFSYFAPITGNRPLIPNRHLKRLVTRRSDVEFVKMIMANCSYLPTYFHVLCDRIAESDVYKTHASDVLTKYLSGVSKLCLLYSYDKKRENFDWYLNDTTKAKDPPYDSFVLFLKAALYSEANSLVSLELRDFNAVMLEESLRFAGPLFYSPLPSKKPHNLPFRWLRDLSLLLRGSSPPSVDCFQKLINIVKNQTDLEKLTLQSIVTDRQYRNERYLAFLTSLAPFVRASRFKLLSLKQMVVPIDGFLSIVDAFYVSPCKHMQSLRIDGCTFVNDGTYSWPDPKVALSPEGANHKSFEIHGSDLPRDFFKLVLARREICLRRLQIGQCKLYQHNHTPFSSWTENIANTLNLVEELRVTKIELTGIAFIHCATTALDFFRLLTNPHIKQLHFRGCHIGHHGVLPDITRGLVQQKSVKMLRSLSLIDNNLADIPHEELTGFLEAIFQLPQVGDFELTLSHNEFSISQMLHIHATWERCCKPKKLSTFTAVSRSMRSGDDPSVSRKIHEIADKVYSW